MTRKVKGFFESDVHGKWRHVLCYVQRPGVRKKGKKISNRRERRDGKRETREV